MMCKSCNEKLEVSEKNTMVSQGILFVRCDNCGAYNVDIELEEDELLDLYMDSKE